MPEENGSLFPFHHRKQTRFSFVLGKAGKQVGDKNNQLLRAG